jgi:hypothetical protein
MMIRKRVPRKLCDYGIRWTTQVMQRTSTQAGELRGACPLEEVTGETVNISEYLDFGFYDHVSFKENTGLGVTSIRRWLGVFHRVGGIMSYWILTIKGTVISRITVQRVTALEKETDEVKAAVVEFNREIASLAANAIAENMFAQVHDEGNRHVLFKEIIDHQTDGTEVKQQDFFLTTRNGN